ncbi:MAG: LapA family protein [Microcoleaceae cyanobacterium]
MTTNLIIILTIIGGLILFAWQNLSPSLAIIILGWQSATLPLSVWIIIAVVFGFISAILVSSFFQVFRSLTKPDYPPSQSSPSTSTSSQYNQDLAEEDEEFDQPNNSRWQVNSAPTTLPVEPQPSQNKILAEDWETDVRPLNPSWNSPPASTTSQTGFNLGKEKQEENWVDNEDSSDSMYSYGSRDPNASGVGQSEAVYDADYRVIVPPLDTQIQSNDNDDDDDEDWIEDDPIDGPDLRKS